MIFLNNFFPLIPQYGDKTFLYCFTDMSIYVFFQ